MPQSHTWRVVRVGGRPAVVAQWQSTGRLKPEVSWVQLPATAGFFTFLYFRFITSKFIYFQHEARCYQQTKALICCEPKLVNFRFMSLTGVSRMFKI